MTHTVQEQARALGDPTRHAVFRAVADAGAPIGVAELTAEFGLNHNAIRQHLAKLVAAGLLVESTAPPSGRGRPRLQYELDEAGAARWGGIGPYERLAVLLAEVLRTGDEPVEVGRRAGLAASAVAGRGDGPVGALVDELARGGFEPSLRQQGGAVEVTLEACPFTSAVLTDAATVCALHLGLARGVAESVGGIEVDELVPQDPRRAACVLRCHLTHDAS